MLFCVFGEVVNVIGNGVDIGEFVVCVVIMFEKVGFDVDYVLVVDGYLKLLIEMVENGGFVCILVVVWIGMMWLIDNLLVVL